MLVQVQGVPCNVWGKGEPLESLWQHKESSLSSRDTGKYFIRYFASVEDGTPLRWIFYDGRQQDIVEFTPGATLPEQDWKVLHRISQLLVVSY